MQSFTTLVVDANFSFAGFLENFLETEGHSILRASSAEDALAKTRRFQPDLILLDNDLNGISAVALLPALLMEQASAAIILLAATPSISEAVEAIKRGAADYLARPINPQKLKQAIDAQHLLFSFGGKLGQVDRRHPGHPDTRGDDLEERRRSDEVGGEAG
jgi:DNA-binding response OmpR family regulator